MTTRKRKSIVRNTENPAIYAPQPFQSPMNLRVFWYVKLWKMVTGPFRKKPDKVKIDAPEGVEVVINPKTTSPDADLKID